MPYCFGFADLTFADSARLALARALDQAATDVFQEHESAWVIEDRRITFSLETENRSLAYEGIKRVLGALVNEAVAGEAVMEVSAPYARWSRKVIPSKAVDAEAFDDSCETIRVPRPSKGRGRGPIAAAQNMATTTAVTEQPSFSSLNDVDALDSRWNVETVLLPPASDGRP